MPEVIKAAPVMAKTVEAAKPAVTPAVKTAKVVDTIGPMGDADAVEAINAVLAEWSAQNQGVARADIQLGNFRTIAQTQRTVIQD